MTSPPVDNLTDFVAEPHTLMDRDGERLCAIVKATFELTDEPPKGLDGTFAIAPKGRRRPIRAADLPWGKPEISSIRYPADLCVRKPGTDVIVVAVAYAPGARPVATFDAGVRVGRLSKVVRIHGPRVWLPDGEGVSEGRPFTSLELRYEHAFGGTDMTNLERIVEDARNPVGRGIASDLAKLGMKAAPQIEDPADPVRSAKSRPRPAGLGVVGRHWLPRRNLWGTYGQDWLESRAPLPPPDFDDRANLAATAELIATPPLVGGEEGALTNLTPMGGVLSFVLPRIRLSITFKVKDRSPEVQRPHLDTLLIDTLAVPPPTPSADGKRARSAPLVIELVWRASVKAPRRAKDAAIVIEELRK